MPQNKDFSEISLRTIYKRKYKDRARKNKRKMAQQLEFDLEAVGAITRDPPTPPGDLLKVLEPRVEELREKTREIAGALA